MRFLRYGAAYKSGIGYRESGIALCRCYSSRVSYTRAGEGVSEGEGEERWVGGREMDGGMRRFEKHSLHGICFYINRSGLPVMDWNKLSSSLWPAFIFIKAKNRDTYVSIYIYMCVYTYIYIYVVYTSIYLSKAVEKFFIRYTGDY